MGGRFSTLERDIGQLHTTVRTGNHCMTTQLLENAQSTQTLVSVSSRRQIDALEQIVTQNNNIMQLLGGIARHSSIPGADEMRRPQIQKRIVHRLLEKPSEMEEVLDGFHGASIVPPNRWTTPRNSVSELQPWGSSNRLTCICNRRHVSKLRRATRIGAFIWQHEATSHGHWPSCPLAHAANEHHQAFGVIYTGFAKIFKSAIEASFSLGYGARGLRLSPTISFRPTVDESSDPVFLILGLIENAPSPFWNCNVPEAKLSAFLMESLSRILESFREAKSTPFATNSENDTILHKLAQIVGCNFTILYELFIV